MATARDVEDWVATLQQRFPGQPINISNADAGGTVAVTVLGLHGGAVEHLDPSGRRVWQSVFSGVGKVAPVTVRPVDGSMPAFLAAQPPGSLVDAAVQPRQGRSRLLVALGIAAVAAGAGVVGLLAMRGGGR